MNSLGRVVFLSRLAITLLLALTSASAADFQYFRAGNKTDASVPASNGIAMLGGGEDLDDAFRWLCAKSPGGDFLVLRARGDDDYNPYVAKLCHLNSAATLIIPDRESAQSPQVDRLPAQERTIAANLKFPGRLFFSVSN